MRLLAVVTPCVGNCKLDLYVVEVMVIEFLYFIVSPESREAFIARDPDVWIAGVAQLAGYVGKVAWAD